MHRFLLLQMTVLLTFLCCPVMAKGALGSAEDGTGNDSIAGFGKRFSFHTNVIDWCIATPNLGLEWDFSGKRTSRYSLGVQAKYRPSTWNKHNPRIVFNTLQVRGELRRYWRTFVYEDYDGIQRDTTVGKFRSMLSYLRYKRLSGARPKRARNWRAYYMGLYAEIDKFTYNISNDGRQGSGAGFGLTAGYTLPLYPMKNGASIDLELGLSVGARIQSYEKFTYEEETHCYAYAGRQERSFVKHPVLADAHVSFVYRFNSIANKVQGCDTRFANRIGVWKDNRLKRDDAHHNRINQKKAQADSLKIVREQAQAQKAAAKKAEEKEKMAKEEEKKAKEEAKEEARKAKEEEKKAAREKAAREKAERKKDKKEKKADEETTPSSAGTEPKPAEGEEQKGGEK